MDPTSLTDAQLVDMIAALPEPGDGADARRGKQFLTNLIVKYDRQTLLDFLGQVEVAQENDMPLTLDDLNPKEKYQLRQMERHGITRRTMLQSTLVVGGLGGFLMADGAMRIAADANADTKKDGPTRRLEVGADAGEVLDGAALVGMAILTGSGMSTLEGRLQSAARVAQRLLDEQATRGPDFTAGR